MTTTSQPSRGFSATKKVFTRPANLHLAWSTSKGVASSLPYPPSTSFSTSQPKSAVPSTVYHFGTPSFLHPYNSPAPPPPSNYNFDSDASSRSSISSSDFSCPSSHAASLSTDAVLKAGHLTWRGSGEPSTKKVTLGGFERALRRRQASRDLVTDKDQEVFVTLEQNELACGRNGSTSASMAKSYSQRSFSTEPFLASPSAHDPTAFDNDSLLSFHSRTVPSCLSEQNRWVPPPSWAVLDTPSDGRASPSRSSASSTSDPLQTPRSSQPSSPMERGVYLNLYSQNSAKIRSSSKGTLQMRLRITRQSTVEMQTCPSQSCSSDGTFPLRRKQLVITGEPAARSQDGFFAASDVERRPSNVVVILSSANVAELAEWLHAIENAIDQCRIPVERINTRRSSGSILDTLHLFEELHARRATDCWGDVEDQHSTPMAVSRSLPALEKSPLPSSAQVVNSSEVDSAFSTSAFIDYYTLEPDSSDVPSPMYTFEDAYASIMRRFAENELPSPLSGLPTAPLEGYVRHARSENLDVPVSPRSFDNDQDAWSMDEDEPSSPLDPWLCHAASRSAESLFHGAFSDDTVLKGTFRESFGGGRRRSSSVAL